MSEFGHQHLDTQEMRPETRPAEGDAGHAHGGHGHMIGMIICCIPMVLAILWVLFSNR